METKVYVHWKKPIHNRITINEWVWDCTYLTVHTGFRTMQNDVHKWQECDPIKLLLIGAASLNVSEGQALILSSDDRSGEPRSLRTDGGELLWERPKDVERYVAIYSDSITVSGPSDRMGGDVIAISWWPGDDWVSIFVPPHLACEIKKVFKNASEIPATRKTQFRNYTILTLDLGTDDLTGDLRSKLAKSLPKELNALVLDSNWS